MKVLVCGGREYGGIPKGCPPDQRRAYEAQAQRECFMLWETLDEFHAAERIAVLIHGGATGADTLAAKWAEKRGVEPMPFKVTSEEWKRLGKRAGPIRNARMLAAGRPNLVLAFPGGDGTANMVAQARAAGVTVREIASSPSLHPEERG